ncbi:ATP synthase subunit gamma, mitochondrial [Microtus ochrogaster]|uniref:ATP synthase subunit gamma, mitochondrial n=1 Tax=Microtus ochrogaster TaxID=79684 RepID=A0A8J6KWP8_MICOH|nr:ATP synthase subunit gamma, mitochondrial [Microtus ochrogaster]
MTSMLMCYIQNYQEYSLANIIYYSLKESTISEQIARMKASDMIDKVTSTHSQPVRLSPEVIETVSGVTAVDE